jgi:hypothetical protein
MPQIRISPITKKMLDADKKHGKSYDDVIQDKIIREKLFGTKGVKVGLPRKQIIRGLYNG